MGRVIRAAFACKLVVIWVFGAVWMTLGVFFLSHFGLWKLDNLKDTIVWCLSAGLVVLVHGFSQRDKCPNYLKIVRDLFKITIFLEILLSSYCFSLPTELILFIVIIFIAALQEYSGRKDEYKAVHKLATVGLVGLGLIMIWGALVGFLHQPGTLLQSATLTAIVRPILLTAWLIPLSYFIGLISAYELLFIPFKLGEKRSLRFHVLARMHLIRHFGLQLNKVLAAPQQLHGGLYGVSTMRKLNELLNVTQTIS